MKVISFVLLEPLGCVQTALPPTLSAWRCGGILRYFCRQLKSIKDIMFNGFYCCLNYNIKLKLPIDREMIMIAPIPQKETGQAV